MMNANKILKRVSEFDKLREAGLTEDEIKELKGMEYDQEMRAAERADQIKKIDEFVYLKNKEEAGLLDEEE